MTDTVLPPTLRLSEVATTLRISRSSAHRMVVDGRLPAFQVGPGWRVLRRDLDRYIEEQLAATLERFGKRG